MYVGIYKCCVGSYSAMYVDINGWDQVVEFKWVWVSKDYKVVKF